MMTVMMIVHTTQRKLNSFPDSLFNSFITLERRLDFTLFLLKFSSKKERRGGWREGKKERRMQTKSTTLTTSSSHEDEADPIESLEWLCLPSSSKSLSFSYFILGGWSTKPFSRGTKATWRSSYMTTSFLSSITSCWFRGRRLILIAILHYFPILPLVRSNSFSLSLSPLIPFSR